MNTDTGPTISFRQSLFWDVDPKKIDAEKNARYINQNPKGEPQLGKRGLYQPLNKNNEPPLEQLAILWVLNLSDGEHSLLDVAERAGINFEEISKAADALMQAGLIKINKYRKGV